MSEVVRDGIGILSMALHSDQPNLVDNADRIINEMAQAGFLDIRDRVQRHEAKAT